MHTQTIQAWSCPHAGILIYDSKHTRTCIHMPSALSCSGTHANKNVRLDLSPCSTPHVKVLLYALGSTRQGAQPVVVGLHRPCGGGSAVVFVYSPAHATCTAIRYFANISFANLCVGAPLVHAWSNVLTLPTRSSPRHTHKALHGAGN